jgi:hypothetical protein
VFIGSRVRRANSSSVYGPDPVDRAHQAKLSARVQQLRRFDPNFSEIILLISVTLWSAHGPRMAKRLDLLSPYLSQRREPLSCN